MARTWTEKKVLKKLGISDFRHMTKEKVIEFASMLHHMDPEVAKAAIAQFPEYVKMASEMVSTYKAIVEKMLSADAENMKAFCAACNSIIASIQEQLRDESLTAAERDSLNNKMIEIAKMIGDKVSEDQKFWLKILGEVGATLLGIGGLALFIFGKGKIPFLGSKS